MPGLAQRLQHELLGVVPDGTRVTVVAPAERQWSAWCGASRLAARPSFQEYWVPKQLYEEEGARCILQHLFDDSKCAALYEGGSRAKGKALLERSKQAVSAVGGARRYISRIERRLQLLQEKNMGLGAQLEEAQAECDRLMKGGKGKGGRK